MEKDKKRPLYFYSGTFSDSLSFGAFCDFNLRLVEFFKGIDEDIYLELRTKSDSIEELSKLEPSKKIIAAFSLNPQIIIDKYEHFTPNLERRLAAIRKLDDKGFQIGIRFDPVFVDYIDEYTELINKIKTIKNLHSVEIGFLRYDKNDYANLLIKNASILKKLIPADGMYRYPNDKRAEYVGIFSKLMHKFYVNME